MHHTARNKILVTYALLHLSASTLAYGAPLKNLAVQIQESRATGIEETTLVFFPKHIEFTTNTNRFSAEAFAGTPRKTARIGAFRIDKDKRWASEEKQLHALKERAAWIAAQKKSPELARLMERPRPHEVRVMIDGMQMPLGGIEHQEAWRILANVIEASDWVTEDGLVVDRDSQKNLRMQLKKGPRGKRVDKAALDTCEKDIQVARTTCEIPSLGFIYGNFLIAAQPEP